MKNVGQAVLIACAVIGAIGILAAGIRYLVRAVWGMVRATERNTEAVEQLTQRWHELAPINGRMTRVETMLLRIWTHLFPGEPPPPDH